MISFVGWFPKESGQQNYKTTSTTHVTSDPDP